MNPRFIGNCEWEPVEDIKWTVGSYGEDRAKVQFCGRRDKKEEFENSIVRFQPLEGFPAMRLNGWSNSGGTINVPGVELEYIGFRSGSIPPVKAVNSFSYQTAQGSGTDTSTGETVGGSIYYRASATTYTWFETSVPGESPRYSNTQLSQNPFDNIRGYHITKQTASGEKTVNTISFGELYAVFNSLIAQDIVQEYSREPLIEGALYACSSRVDYMLTS